MILRLERAIFIALFLFFGNHTLWAFFNSGHCLKVLLKNEGMTGAEITAREFVEKGLLPVVGSRLLFAPEPRACSHENGCTKIYYRDAKGKESAIVIQETKDSLLPQVEYKNGEIIFKVPHDFNYDSWRKRDEFIQTALLGHEVHPHWVDAKGKKVREEHDEPFIISKKVQREGAIAAIESQKNGAKEFLYVAPTGTGKTEVIKDVLEHQILNSGKKVHFLVADKSLLVDQLHGDVKELASDMQIKYGTDVRIIHWGGEHGENLPKWKEFESQYLDPNDPRPVVVVSTDKSLHSFVMSFIGKKEYKDNFQKQVGSLIFDEAHHAGSPTSTTIIERIRNGEHSDVFLMGMTATPFHADHENFPDIFGRHAFWAYVDDADSYLRASQPVYRSTQTIIDQYARAIEAGELTPVDHVYYLEAKKHFNIEPDKFFTPGKGGRFQIDPNQRGVVANRLMPIFTKHKKGFVTCATVDEANKMAMSLNLNSFGKKFAVLHSGLDNDGKPIDKDDILRRFRGGPGVKPEEKIDFLVTVGMLDEGLNFPDMTLLVDLNHSTGKRQALQRMGRLLRLNPGKTAVDIVTLHEFNEESLRDDLDLFNAIQRGDLNPRPYSPAGQAKKVTEETNHPRWETSPFSETNYLQNIQSLIAAGKDFFTRQRKLNRLDQQQLDLIEKYVLDTYGKIPSVDSTLYLDMQRLESQGILEKNGSPYLKEALAKAKADPDRVTAHEAFQYWTTNKKFPDLNSPHPAVAKLAKEWRSLLRRESEFFAAFENQEFVNQAHAHFELSRRFQSPKSYPHETTAEIAEAQEAAKKVSALVSGVSIKPGSDAAELHYKYRNSASYRTAANEKLRHVIDLEEMNPQVYWLNEAKAFYEIYDHLPAENGTNEIDEGDIAEMLDYYIRRNPDISNESNNANFNLAIEERRRLMSFSP